MTTRYASENDIERQRLFDLTARLTAKGFPRPMPNGWTVGTKLAHLAFWDMYYLTCVEGWERTGFVAFRVNVDVINEAVRTLSRAIPAESVVQLVRDAAEAIDRKVETLTPELASAIETGGYTRILHRALHRREHLDQIEKVLGSKVMGQFKVAHCPPESGGQHEQSSCGGWFPSRNTSRLQTPGGEPGFSHFNICSGVAELYWYEAHGIGRKEIRRKRFLE